jgi:hypothetical protein
MSERMNRIGLKFSLRLVALTVAVADIPAKGAESTVEQAQTISGNASHEPGKAPGIVGRDRAADAKLIDLTNYYTLALNEDASGNFGYILSSLPKGVQRIGNTDYDLRGVVQVSGQQFVTAKKEFPETVKGIRVRLKCEKLFFFGATRWSEDKGVQIGTYVIHYVNGDKEEIPIRYGMDVRDWMTRRDPATRPAANARPPVPTAAWTGADKDKAGVEYSLFEKRWTNPHPELEIVSIDLVSSMTNAAPFLVAVTAQ